MDGVPLDFLVTQEVKRSCPMWREHRGPFSLYGVGSQEAPHSPQKAVLGSVDMKSGWYHFSQLSQDTPQHHFHTSMHNWNHSSCPALAELWEYFFFVFVVLLYCCCFSMKTFFITQATNWLFFFLSFLFQQSYVSSSHQMAPPSPNTNSSSNSSGGGGEQLSKTNLYIRGLHPGTTDQDLVKLCQP